MIRIYKKQRLDKTLYLSHFPLKKFSGTPLNDNNNKIDEFIKKPPKIRDKFLNSYGLYIKMFHFMKRYFLPFYNKNSFPI